MMRISMQRAGRRFAELLLLASLALAPFCQVGCGHRVINAVEDLQPEAERRNEELEQLAKPTAEKE
ncbi:MAG: hypothetical protein NXI22_26395 [bacterium]|nr:hypothetical protein [bacterium]